MIKKRGNLVGKFFHSLSQDGSINWQGHILSKVGKNIYMIELFDWAIGEPSVQKLVELDEMKNWMFYDDSEWMRYSYDYGEAKAKVKKIENNVDKVQS